ncbi:MAG: hypothetical protein H7X88_07555 [Gloeobacteraceae cyanobacterium ES-bin-316]|nr:hypothetical protein [Ferruginibacter sp.]
MKQIIFFALMSCTVSVFAQNVGVGSLNPQKKLTVNGSILLDENNTNDGILDSAALLFGTNGGVGIASKKTSAGWQNGLSFFTNGLARMTVASNGYVGINAQNPTSLLHVGGTIRSSTDIWASGLGRFDGRLAIGGAGLPEYKFHNNGNSYFGGAVNVTGPVGVTGATSLTGVLNVSGYTTIDDGMRLNGKLGINGPSSALYGLSVHNLPSFFNGPVTMTGDVSVGSTLNVGGDGIVDNNFRVNGRAGINGPTNANYGLIVNNANSYFDGNATVQSNLTVQGSTNLQGNVTIQGNGHVRSNGASALRISFQQQFVGNVFDGREEKVYTVNLPAFDATADNIRVNISSFEPTANSSTSHFKWYVYDVDYVTDTCKIRVINESNSQYLFQGAFYLMIVVKD